MKKMLWLIAYLLFRVSLSYASPDEEIVIEYEEDSYEEETSGVERILRNKTLQRGLAAGTASLNRSIDSLMEALFYKLMDNQLVYDLTDFSEIQLGLTRNLHETKDGAYVVVDRMSLGPNFSTPITNISGLPITFGGNGSVNVMDIYLRTDGQRLVEEESLPYWRVLVNNWFGLLPFLTAILPPSFNPNELYDPLGELETPFLFPTTVDSALTMKVGNLRSYSVDAVVHLGLDLLAREEQYSISRLGQSFGATLPFKVFKEGEHRINVLRKEDSVFWIGLSSTDRVGHKFEGQAGRLFYVFSKVTSNWSGIPAVILPIDFDREDADVYKYDRLYEFDLSKPKAVKAFEKGVVGDFSVADEYARDSSESGVKFHFTRYSKGVEVSSSFERNLFVHKTGRKMASSIREIKTEEDLGDFYILEARSQVEDENLDVLVGPESENFESRAFVRVKKKNSSYEIDKSVESPMGIVLGLRIQDGFVDSMEFRRYISDLRDYSRMPLESVPRIPIRGDEREKNFRRKKFARAPHNDIYQIGLAPLHLGKMSANAEIHLDSQHIDILKSKSALEVAEAFCSAFELDPREASKYIGELNYRDIAAYALIPASLLRLQVPEFNISLEIRERVAALNRITVSKDPLEILGGFEDFLDSKYPMQFSNAVLRLLQDDVPKKVSFVTKSKGKSYRELKELFSSLNGRTFESKEAVELRERYEFIREKLLRFKPDNMKEERLKPQIRSIRLGVRESEGRLDPQIFIVLGMQGQEDISTLRVFLRLEQAGKVNVGRFVLFEGVLKIDSQRATYNRDFADELDVFEFRLAGESADLDSFVVQQALDIGGEFSLSLSASKDGELWSKERRVDFRLQSGKLLRPKEQSNR